ncbi:MAG TPA: YtxH domain-containing protein [Gemmatimonadaceae bacterium]|nr:YtxH domain-containing protein [Gemmatimonadaceae bacterium]
MDDHESDDRHDDETSDRVDLLTALALGIAVGAGVALLFRRGPSGDRPADALLAATRRGAERARRSFRRGARWAAEHAETLRNGAKADDLKDQVGDYMRNARETIDDAVSHELRELRRAIRRRRKRLGV